MHMHMLMHVYLMFDVDIEQHYCVLISNSYIRLLTKTRDSHRVTDIAAVVFQLYPVTCVLRRCHI